MVATNNSQVEKDPEQEQDKDQSNLQTKQLTLTTEHKRRKKLNGGYKYNSQDEEDLE